MYLIAPKLYSKIIFEKCAHLPKKFFWPLKKKKIKFLFWASSITCTTSCPISRVTTPLKKSLGIIGCAMVEPLCFHELYKAYFHTPVGKGKGKGRGGGANPRAQSQTRKSHL